MVQNKRGSVGPYAYKGDQWVSYDDVLIVRIKVTYKSLSKISKQKSTERPCFLLISSYNNFVYICIISLCIV